MQSEHEPHEDGGTVDRRAGPLRNGNPRGNPHTAPRCGARTRGGTACRAPAMCNGRCRMHGGASTGARTPAGQAASRTAALKHAFWSQEQQAYRAALRRLLRQARAMVRVHLSDPAAWPVAPPAQMAPSHRSRRRPRVRRPQEPCS